MNITLKRKKFIESGIFGELLDDKGNFVAVSLEHAYLQEDGSYKAKVNVGTHECKIGAHHLKSMLEGELFQTYAVQSVIEFDGTIGVNILFHVLNYNRESEGCIGVGEQIGTMLNGGNMITNSKVAFKRFMAMQNGAESFTLSVS